MAILQTFGVPKNITLNLIKASVEVLTGSEFQVIVYNKDVNKTISVSQQGDSLTLTEPEGEGFEIKLTLLDTLDSLTINTTDSNIFLNRVEINNVNINTTEGSTEINGCKCHDVKINNPLGDILIDCRSGFDNLEIMGEDGNIDVYIKDNVRNMKVSTGNGDIDISLKNDFDNMEVSSESGDVFVKVEEVEGFDLTVNTNDGEIDSKVNAVTGKNKVKVTTDDGNIKLRHK